MKKFIITLLSLLLILTVPLGGCGGSGSSGCAGCSNNKSPLSFTKAFYNGEGEPSIGYTETAIYKVTFNDNYNEDFKKSEAIKSSVLDYSFSDGEYKTVLEVKPNSSLTELPESVSGFITSNSIYKLTTTFSISVDYTLKGQPQPTVTDFINRTVYFYTQNNSYTPIYSKTESKYTIVDFRENSASLQTEESENEIIYKKSSYKVNGSSVSYQPKTVIDNAELLFAMRNINISSGKSFYLPVVEASYKTDKTLLVTNQSENTGTFSFDYNGATYSEEKIKVKNLKYSLDESKTSGKNQYVTIQKSESESGNIPSMALMLKYVSPLMTYGTFANMGALVYTLNSVTVTNN